MSIRQVQKVGALLTVGVLCIALLAVIFCWPSPSSVTRSVPRSEPMLTLPYRVPIAPAPGITLPYHVPAWNTPDASSRQSKRE